MEDLMEKCIFLMLSEEQIILHINILGASECIVSSKWMD